MIRSWTDEEHPLPAGGTEIRGRHVVGIDDNGNVRWLDTTGEGCSTPARWREWEIEGPEVA